MDNKMIKAMARQRVMDTKYPAKKLALIYIGVTVISGLLLSLLGAFLEGQMDAHGGLGGMEFRTALSMLQTALMVAVTLATPFWNLGYTSAALKTARNESPEPKSLLAGFRVILPGLRLYLLQIAVVMAVSILAMQVGTILYVMSPASDGALIFLEQMLKDVSVIDEAMALDILKLMWPMYLMIGIVLLALLIPVAYRLRLTDFQLLEGHEGALRNMALSRRKMRGNCFRFFRLDLGFWWYYLLQLAAVALSYGDALVGDSQLAYWGFYIASCVGQVVVAYCFLPRVATTYAVAYDEITKEKEQEQQQ